MIQLGVRERVGDYFLKKLMVKGLEATKEFCQEQVPEEIDKLITVVQSDEFKLLSRIKPLGLKKDERKQIPEQPQSY